MLRTTAALAALAGAFWIQPAAATTGVTVLTCGSAVTDHTGCIQKWLNVAQSGGGDLYAPAGEWIYSAPVHFWPNTRIRCAGPGATRFKRTGTASTFLAPDAKLQSVENVIVENCGFDVNGGTSNFLSVISINLGTSKSKLPVRSIQVRGNRFYDSAFASYQPTDDNQRQFVLLVPCFECRVEDNQLSGAGRIKVGRPGERLFIRNNTLENVNDNAITIADSTSSASADIVIDGNVIVSPRAVGIFVGADGQEAGQAGNSALNLQVSGNIVRGNWTTACIQATLPPSAARVHIQGNICTKTGSLGEFAGGINVTRTTTSTAAARDLLIGANTVVAANGRLDSGIALSGSHDGVRILGNQVRDAAIAIKLRNLDPAKEIREAVVADNVMRGGGLEINGGFSGDVRGNAVFSAPDAAFLFQSPKIPVRGTVAGNSVSAAKACMRLSGTPPLELDIVGNSFHQCGAMEVFTGLAAGHARLHNLNDAASNRAPTGHLNGTRAWNAAVAPGATIQLDVPVHGATPGDIASAGFDAIATDDFDLRAYVQIPHYVRVLLTNRSAAAATLNGTVRAQAWKFN